MSGFAAPLQTANITGTPFFVDDERISTPGITQTLFSVTPLAGQIINLVQLSVTYNFPAIVEIFIDGSIVGSQTIGPLGMIPITWPAPRPAIEGESIEVKFTASSLGPAIDIRSHFILALEDA